MKDYVRDTLQYYRENTMRFIEKTKNADMEYLYNVFEKYINPGGNILDLGCGTGRDSKHFIQEGYQVTAIDGSSELCDYAAEEIGQPVRCMLFSQLDYKEKFDGIWASASLLHVSKEDIDNIIELLYKALKPEGYLYVSFKHGDFEGMRDNKYYSDYTVNDVRKLFDGHSRFTIAEYVEGEDVRDDIDTEWVNVVVRRAD
ncbi:MAG: class I SAM-dependent methyltransferase [Eubacteriales bacterium]